MQIQKLDTIIVDDEATSRKALKEELLNFEHQINIVAEANSLVSAIEVINKFKPQLVFLDINLGDGTAFEVLEKISWKNFKIVFVTAYDEYALKAFNFNTIDYILKPIAAADLERVFEKLGATRAYNEMLISSIGENLRVNNNSKLVVHANDGIYVFDINDIVHLQSDGNYTNIFSTNSEKLMIAKTLKEFDDYLLSYGFERVHNSHLINKSKIKKYLNKDGGYIVMSDGSEIPISQRKKTYVLKMIESL